MRQRIENRILITCEDLDLSTLTDLEVYIEQGERFFQYVPQVLSPHTLLVIMPVEDSKRLTTNTVKIQMAYTDAAGVPDATGIATVPVTALLKESGYDPS